MGGLSASAAKVAIRIADRDAAPAPGASAPAGSDPAVSDSCGSDPVAFGLAADPAVAARAAADIARAPHVPVDLATGDLLLFQRDVSLPGALPLVIGRAYRSSWRAGQWFGPSWASTFDQRLLVGSERILGVFSDGRVLCWSCRADADRPVPATGLPVSGPRWRLERVGDDFTVTDPRTGLAWRFAPRPGHHLSAAGTGELPLVCVTDRGGHRVSFGYTEAGLPASVTHSGGYRIRVLVSGARIGGLVLCDDAAGQEAAVPAGAGAGAGVPLVAYQYDQAGNLAAILDSSGRPLRFRYDERGRLVGWDDRTGIPYRYAYDERGRCVTGAGQSRMMSVSFAYGDRVTWHTDTVGAVTIYQFDEASRLRAVTDPLGNVTHFWHDEFGRVTAHADPLGRLTRYTFDEHGNVTCLTRPDGSQVRAAYDRSGQLVTLDGPDGSGWKQDYDPRGRLVRRVAPDGGATSYGYDERGHLASIISPLGAVTRVECDRAGLPLAVCRPGAGRSRYERDRFGRVTVITWPGGEVTRLSWTVEGRPLSLTYADGSSERYGYDAEGNLISHLIAAVKQDFRQQDGRPQHRHGESRYRQSSFEYGPFGLLTAMTGPDGTRTQFGYDRGLRLTAVTRAGMTWRYCYDPAGRLVAETDYNGATTRYAYDPAGQLTSRDNAIGQRISCDYDELGRLIERVADGVVTTFGYDAAGRLAHARNPGAEIRLSRDAAGRVVAETCNGATVLSSYDLAGRRTRRVTPGGIRQRWRYDDCGRPVRLECGAGGATGYALGFGYDQAGREIQRRLPGSVILAQLWDPAGRSPRLASQVLTAGAGEETVRPGTDRGNGEHGADRMDGVDGINAVDGMNAMASGTGSRRVNVLARRAYAYRADGSLVGVDDLLAGPRRFTLDRVGRVTAVSGPGWAERYGYDPAGTIASARWTAPHGAAEPWLAADVQGPRDRVGTLITRAGTIRYQHDARGRVIRRQRMLASGPPETWAYRWDADDRLTAVTTPDGSTWRYRYDPLGRRISKRCLDPSGALAAQASFTWDGAVLAEEETASAGAPARQRRVTWDCLPGSCIPLAQAETVSASGASGQAARTCRYAIITDQAGIPAELVNAHGTVAGYRQHTVWGGTLWHPDGASTALRFPGQYHDKETGLHYDRGRYYDPVTGSYLTPDPLGLAVSLNPHAYRPNPHVHVGLTDPPGLPGLAVDVRCPFGESRRDPTGPLGFSGLPASASYACDASGARAAAIRWPLPGEIAEVADALMAGPESDHPLAGAGEPVPRYPVGNPGRLTAVR